MDTNTYFVVGGSGGIGREITRQLSAQGHCVLAGSRSAEQLGELDGVTPIPLDVCSC